MVHWGAKYNIIFDIILCRSKSRDKNLNKPAFSRTSTVSRILPPVVITSSMIRQDSPASNIPGVVKCSYLLNLKTTNLTCQSRTVASKMDITIKVIQKTTIFTFNHFLSAVIFHLFSANNHGDIVVH